MDFRNTRALDITEWASCVTEAMQQLKRAVVLKKEEEEEGEKMEKDEKKKKGQLNNS